MPRDFLPSVSRIFLIESDQKADALVRQFCRKMLSLMGVNYGRKTFKCPECDEIKVYSNIVAPVFT